MGAAVVVELSLSGRRQLQVADLTQRVGAGLTCDVKTHGLTDGRTDGRTGASRDPRPSELKFNKSILKENTFSTADP